MRFWLLLFFCPVSAIAAQDDLKSDLREECRAALGGIVMGLNSELELTQRTVDLLSRKKTQILVAKKNAEKVLKAFLDDWKHHEYDPSYNDKNTELSFKLKLLNEQWDENRAFMKESEQKLLKLKKEYQVLNQRVAKLFVLRPGKGADPMKLEYKKSCPPYQHVCPLAAKEVPLLLDIVPKPHTPLACERYAQIR